MAPPLMSVETVFIVIFIICCTMFLYLFLSGVIKYHKERTMSVFTTNDDEDNGYFSIDTNNIPDDNSPTDRKSFLKRRGEERKLEREKDLAILTTNYIIENLFLEQKPLVNGQYIVIKPLYENNYRINVYDSYVNPIVRSSHFVTYMPKNEKFATAKLLIDSKANTLRYDPTEEFNDVV